MSRVQALFMAWLRTRRVFAVGLAYPEHASVQFVRAVDTGTRELPLGSVSIYEDRDPGKSPVCFGTLDLDRAHDKLIVVCPAGRSEVTLTGTDSDAFASCITTCVRSMHLMHSLAQRRR